jgi:hypothetical protein
MMANVGDPMIALFFDDGLVGAAGLQVVVAHSAHVAHFGLLLRCRRPRERSAKRAAKHK